MKLQGTEAGYFLDRLMSNTEGYAKKMHGFMKQQAWYQKELFEGSMETFRNQLGTTFIKTLATLHKHGEHFIDKMTDALKDPIIQQTFVDFGKGLIDGLSAGWEFTKKVVGSIIDLFKPAYTFIESVLSVFTGGFNGAMSAAEKFGKILGALLAGSLGIKFVTTLLKVKTTLGGLGMGFRNLVANLKSGEYAFYRFSAAANQANMAMGGGMLGGGMGVGSVTGREAMKQQFLLSRQMEAMQKRMMFKDPNVLSKALEKTSPQALKMLSGQFPFLQGRLKNQIEKVIPENLRSQYLGPGKRWEYMSMTKAGLPFFYNKNIEKTNWSRWDKLKYGLGSGMATISSTMTKAGQIPILGSLGRLIKGHPILSALTIGGGILKVRDQISKEFEKGIGEGILGAVQWSARGVIAQGLDIFKSIAGFGMDILSMLGLGFMANWKDAFVSTIDDWVDILEGKMARSKLKISTIEIDKDALQNAMTTIQGALTEKDTGTFFGVGSIEGIIEKLKPAHGQFITMQAEIANLMKSDDLTEIQRKNLGDTLLKLQQASTVFRQGLETRDLSVLNKALMNADTALAGFNDLQDGTTLGASNLLSKYSSLNKLLVQITGQMATLGMVGATTGKDIPDLLIEGFKNVPDNLKRFLSEDFKSLTMPEMMNIGKYFAQAGLSLDQVKKFWPVLQKMLSEPDISKDALKPTIDPILNDSLKSIDEAKKAFGIAGDNIASTLIDGITNKLASANEQQQPAIEKYVTDLKNALLDEMKGQGFGTVQDELEMAKDWKSPKSTIDKSDELKKLFDTELTADIFKSNEAMAGFLKKVEDITGPTSVALDEIKGKFASIATIFGESDIKTYFDAEPINNVKTAIQELQKELSPNSFKGFIKGLLSFGYSVGPFKNDLKDIKDSITMLSSLKFDVDPVSGEYIVRVTEKAGEAEKQFKLTKDSLGQFISWLKQVDSPSGLSTMISKLTQLDNKLITSLPLLQTLAKMSVLNPVAPINIPQPGLLAHAEGGVVTRAHLGMVGERGPEAIIPIDRYLEHFEKISGEAGGSSKPVAYTNNSVYNITVNVPDGVTREEAVAIVQRALTNKDEESKRREFMQRQKNPGVVYSGRV